MPNAIEIRDLSDVRLREWVVELLHPPALHARVCECLCWRIETRICEVSLGRPEAPAARFTFHDGEGLSVFGDFIRETIRQRTERNGGPDGLPLHHVLGLLEGLTITLPGSLSRRDLAKVTKKGPEEALRLVTRHFHRWPQLCLAPIDRDLVFLGEYQVVLGTLQALVESSGRPVGFLLKDLIAHDGQVTLSGWSCALPKNWQQRCLPDASPSDWTEFLLACKHGTNTRYVKERLKRARQEQRIAEIWGAYGDWLRDRPQDLRALKELLGVTICLSPDQFSPFEPGEKELPLKK